MVYPNYRQYVDGLAHHASAPSDSENTD